MAQFNAEGSNYFPVLTTKRFDIHMKNE